MRLNDENIEKLAAIRRELPKSRRKSKGSRAQLSADAGLTQAELISANPAQRRRLERQGVRDQPQSLLFPPGFILAVELGRCLAPHPRRGSPDWEVPRALLLPTLSALERYGTLYGPVPAPEREPYCRLRARRGARRAVLYAAGAREPTPHQRTSRRAVKTVSSGH